MRCVSPVWTYNRVFRWNKKQNELLIMLKERKTHEAKTYKGGKMQTTLLNCRGKNQLESSGIHGQRIYSTGLTALQWYFELQSQDPVRHLDCQHSKGDGMLRRRNTCSMLFVFFLLLKTFYILLYLYRRQKLLTITNFTDTENCTIADFFLMDGINPSTNGFIQISAYFNTKEFILSKICSLFHLNITN